MPSNSRALILNSTYNEYVLTNKPLYGCLQTTLTSSALANVISVDSMCALQKLELRCGSSSEANLSILTGNLQTITQGKDSMTTYLDKVKAIHDQMLVAGPELLMIKL